MSKQVQAALQKTPKHDKTKFENSYHTQLKNRTFLNKSKDNSFINYSCKVDSFFGKSKLKDQSQDSGPAERKINLLNKVKSIKRINFEKPNEDSWQNIQTLIKEAYYDRDTLQKKEIKRTGLININYDSSNFDKPMKIRGREVQQQEKSKFRHIQAQLKILKDQLNKIYQQNESLRMIVADLHEQNSKLRSQVIQISSRIQALKRQNKKSQDYSIAKLLELQQFIEHFQSQNKELQLQIQHLIENGSNKRNKHNMQIKSFINNITIPAKDNKDIEKLLNEYRELKMELFNVQKKQITNVNQLKKEHQKQIFTLRNTFFKSLNFYRNLIKKCTTNQITDRLKQPQELLQTDIMQVDEDYENIDANNSFQQDEKLENQ